MQCCYVWVWNGTSFVGQSSKPVIQQQFCVMFNHNFVFVSIVQWRNSSYFCVLKFVSYTTWWWRWCCKMCCWVCFTSVFVQHCCVHVCVNILYLTLEEKYVKMHRKKLLHKTQLTWILRIYVTNIFSGWRHSLLPRFEWCNPIPSNAMWL